MSTMPSSFRMGPSTTNTLVHKRYMILHILIIWLSGIYPLFLAGNKFYKYAIIGDTNQQIIYFVLLPLFIFAYYIIWVLCAIFISAFFLKIIKLIHKPREGYFPRDPKNKDYKYWSLRATVKKFALWLSHNFWIPWLDILACKLYGMKISIKTTVFDSWIDTEFVECGKNVTIGQGACVMGAMITRDWLIIKTTKIHDNVVVGGYSVVSPGTEIMEGTVLGAASSTLVGQVLDPNWVYLGSPAKQFKKNKMKYDTSYSASSKAKGENHDDEEETVEEEVLKEESIDESSEE